MAIALLCSSGFFLGISQFSEGAIASRQHLVPSIEIQACFVAVYLHNPIVCLTWTKRMLWLPLLFPLSLLSIMLLAILTSIEIILSSG